MNQGILDAIERLKLTLFVKKKARSFKEKCNTIITWLTFIIKTEINFTLQSKYSKEPKIG